jgi:hypothetical protein
MATKSIRISQELHARIKREAKRSGRSIREQAEHWIQMGLYIDRTRHNARAVKFERGRLIVEFRDGYVRAPLADFPGLLQGTKKQRENYRILASGSGISWPDLDEDISVEALIAKYGLKLDAIEILEREVGPISPAMKKRLDKRLKSK